MQLHWIETWKLCADSSKDDATSTAIVKTTRHERATHHFCALSLWASLVATSGTAAGHCLEMYKGALRAVFSARITLLTP